MYCGAAGGQGAGRQIRHELVILNHILAIHLPELSPIRKDPYCTALFMLETCISAILYHGIDTESLVRSEQCKVLIDLGMLYG